MALDTNTVIALPAALVPDRPGMWPHVAWLQARYGGIPTPMDPRDFCHVIAAVRAKFEVSMSNTTATVLLEFALKLHDLTISESSGVCGSGLFASGGDGDRHVGRLCRCALGPGRQGARAHRSAGTGRPRGRSQNPSPWHLFTCFIPPHSCTKSIIPRHPPAQHAPNFLQERRLNLLYNIHRAMWRSG